MEYQSTCTKKNDVQNQWNVSLHQLFSAFGETEIWPRWKKSFKNFLMSKKCTLWHFSYLSFHQVHTNRKTQPCAPTLNKIDVEALKRDFKKVVEHYPVGISRAWTQWLQDVDKLLELPTDWEWPLDILKRCSKVQRPANEDIIIPDHLQAMREKETVETQQVWLFVYGKWCLVLVLWVKRTHRFSRQAQLTCTL